MAVLYGIDAFSILVPSTKKRYSSILKKAVVFQKICFKSESIENVQNVHCHIKACRSLKRKVVLKIPSAIF